ncbi:MAG: zinc ribbon domain-containing protein, partial [Deltaproteobacteria bacterium]|nr:zinc ribbon domain-containing protein [Deltaproteobacteria bacterium]
VNWLERRGEVVRAEFLRLDCVLAQMSPEDPRYAHTRRRLLELAPRISVDWRSRVSRSLIEGCTTTTGRCPAYWRALPSDSDDVRNCNVCGEHVFYCVTIDLARSRTASGQRVALDMTCDRFHGDLQAREAHCGSCRSPVPPNTRFCPHCGRAL